MTRKMCGIVAPPLNRVMLTRQRCRILKRTERLNALLRANQPEIILIRVPARGCGSSPAASRRCGLIIPHMMQRTAHDERASRSRRSTAPVLTQPLLNSDQGCDCTCCLSHLQFSRNGNPAETIDRVLPEWSCIPAEHLDPAWRALRPSRTDARR
jgi:hypothetical protein